MSLACSRKSKETSVARTELSEGERGRRLGHKSVGNVGKITVDLTGHC